MNVESLCLIVKENDENTAMVWFPTVRDFVEISTTNLTKKENEKTYLGKFYRLVVPVNQNWLKSFHYIKLLKNCNEENTGNSFLLPSPYSVKIIHNSSNIIVCDVPVFIGTYNAHEKCHIGYSSFFGRIYVSTAGKNTQVLDQFQTYLCDIRIANPEIRLHCKWEAVVVISLSEVMPNIQMERARVRSIDKDIVKLYQDEEESSILVDRYDFQQHFIDDLVEGQTIKVVCEAKCDQKLPRICCFATVKVQEDVPIEKLPLEDLQTRYYNTSCLCKVMIDKIVEKLGLDDIKDKYDSQLYEILLEHNDDLKKM